MFLEIDSRVMTFAWVFVNLPKVNSTPHLHLETRMEMPMVTNLVLHLLLNLHWDLDLIFWNLLRKLTKNLKNMMKPDVRYMSPNINWKLEIIYTYFTFESILISKQTSPFCFHGSKFPKGLSSLCSLIKCT